MHPGERRAELLGSLEAGNPDEFVLLMQNRYMSRAVSSDGLRGEAVLQDTLESLSKEAIVQLWTKAYHLLTVVLLDEEFNADDAQCARSARGIILSTTFLAQAHLRCEDHFVPAQMLEAATMMHGLIPRLPEETMPGAALAVSLLCHTWWWRDLSGRENLITNSYLFLLKKSLKKKAVIADIKNVWVMRTCLHELSLSSALSATMSTSAIVDFDNEDEAADAHAAEELQSTLLRCLHHQKYCKTKEGRNFFTYLLTVDERFMSKVHKEVKRILVDASSATVDMFADVYLRAWNQCEDDDIRIRLEQGCIQSIMSSAVGLKRGGPMALSSKLRKFLSHFHKSKRQRQVDDMLARLYEPILWRSLHAANSEVRASAADLFFDAFPILTQDATTNVAREEKLNRQFALFQPLLYDDSPYVRSSAVSGVCRAFSLYWEVFSTEFKDQIIGCLIKDLAFDSTSADVRYSVLKGILYMIDNFMSHQSLIPRLTKLSHMVHDTSEKVRVAFIDLLIRLKSIKNVKYWNLASLEHILSRLQLDGPAVCRRVVTLISNSFIPFGSQPQGTGSGERDTDQRGDIVRTEGGHGGGKDEELISRCISLVDGNEESARKFYQYALRSINLLEAVRLLMLLRKYIKSCVKREQRRLAQLEQASTERQDREETNPSMGTSQLSAISAHDATILLNITANLSLASTAYPGLGDVGDNQDEQGGGGDGEEGEHQSTEVTVHDKTVMRGLLDVISVLWSGVAVRLEKPSHADTKKQVHHKFCQDLPAFFMYLKGPGVHSTLLYLAKMLPPALMPVISRSGMPKLKKLSEDCSLVQELAPLLDTLVSWNRLADILDLFDDWLVSVLPPVGDRSRSSLGSSRAGGSQRRVRLVEPTEEHGGSTSKPLLALRSLHYLLEDTASRQEILSKHRSRLETLEKTLTAILDQVSGPSPTGGPPSIRIVVSSHELLCKLALLKHLGEEEQNSEENSTAAAAGKGSEKVERAVKAVEHVLVESITLILPHVVDEEEVGEAAAEETDTRSPQRKVRRLFRRSAHVLEARRESGHHSSTAASTYIKQLIPGLLSNLFRIISTCLQFGLPRCHRLISLLKDLVVEKCAVKGLLSTLPCLLHLLCQSCLYVDSATSWPSLSQAADEEDYQLAAEGNLVEDVRSMFQGALTWLFTGLTDNVTSQTTEEVINPIKPTLVQLLKQAVPAGELSQVFTISVMETVKVGPTPDDDDNGDDNSDAAPSGCSLALKLIEKCVCPNVGISSCFLQEMRSWILAQNSPSVDGVAPTVADSVRGMHATSKALHALKTAKRGGPTTVSDLKKLLLSGVKTVVQRSEDEVVLPPSLRTLMEPPAAASADESCG